MADRESVLRQLEGILSAGYEGIGWTLFRGGRQLDRKVKESLKRGLVEYIYGREAPNSGDELTFFVARQVMRELTPRLMLVNVWDMDIAHWGAHSLYLQAITNTDRLCGMLWDEVQSNRADKDETTLLILPELGRDGGQDTANGFLNHRSDAPSCRHVWMLALGAGSENGRDGSPDIERGHRDDGSRSSGRPRRRDGGRRVSDRTRLNGSALIAGAPAERLPVLNALVPLEFRPRGQPPRRP